MKKMKMAAMVGIAFCAIASGVQAAPVTSLAGTVVPMAAVNLFSAGPITQAPGIVWSSDDGSSVFGWTSGYGFAGNGFWSGSPPMIGSNSPSATMEYAFSTLQSGVGGTINYAPGFGTPVISVFDSSHTLIESTTLSFSTSGAGEFHGFLESSATIAYFSLSGAYIGLRDLTITDAAAPVPEPETYAMLLAGLGLLGFAARRRKQKELAAA